MTLKHTAVVAVADDGTSPVGSDEWNADHTVSGTSLQLQYNNAGSLSGANVWRESADSLAQRNSTTAQSQYVYNTYTDASNYERGVFDWATTANVLTIGMQKVGTGSVRDVQILAPSCNCDFLATSGGNIIFRLATTTNDLRIAGSGFLSWPNGGSVTATPDLTLTPTAAKVL